MLQMTVKDYTAQTLTYKISTLFSQQHWQSWDAEDFVLTKSTAGFERDPSVLLLTGWLLIHFLADIYIQSKLYCISLGLPCWDWTHSHRTYCNVWATGTPMSQDIITYITTDYIFSAMTASIHLYSKPFIICRVVYFSSNKLFFDIPV